MREGGFLIVGSMPGVPGEVALGVSLVERVCGLIAGLPGWRITEGAGLFRGQSRQGFFRLPAPRASVYLFRTYVIIGCFENCLSGGPLFPRWKKIWKI